ncbi:MAG: adenosylcobinamide-phosphate synthase CbiB [Candidatus Binataceae bacterium]
MNYAFHLSAPLIATALAIDFVAGDPRWMPHPVRLIGAAISFGERILRTGDERRDLRNGFILALATIVLSGTCAWIIIATASCIAVPLGAAAATLIAWTTLALRGLDDAARQVERAVESNDEALARSVLPALVGRDPEKLDRAGMIRATIESVAENTSDGVIAPLLFLFAGGPVAALAYKAVNTLDSMIGYRDERYFFFGRAAARIDDVANYLPARLTAICLIAAAHFVTGRAPQAWAVCRADARTHASPNAGFPEAAVAGALGIQLGGDAIYGGEVEHRAALGRAERAPTVTDIVAARAMMSIAAAAAFCLLTVARSMIVTVFA